MRFVLALLFLVRLAHADVGVVVTGDPNMQTRVIDGVQRWLQDRKHALVAAPLGDASTSLIDCFVIEDMSCAQKVFDQNAKASTVVFVRVDMTTSETRDYTLNGFWFTKGRDVVAEKRTCSQCDDTALAGTIEGMMSELSRKGARGMGRLKVSGGVGMLLKIDGEDVGAPPLDREIEAGSHELVFLHQGSPVDVRRVEVETGGTVEVAGPRIVNGEVRAPRSRRSRVVPALLIGTGLVAAAVGGVFLYYGSLRGPDEPYVYTNATEIGLPLALAGAFAVGAGTSLYFSGSGSEARVGVSGSF